MNRRAVDDNAGAGRFDDDEILPEKKRPRVENHNESSVKHDDIEARHAILEQMKASPSSGSAEPIIMKPSTEASTLTAAEDPRSCKHLLEGLDQKSGTTDSLQHNFSQGLALEQDSQHFSLAKSQQQKMITTAQAPVLFSNENVSMGLPSGYQQSPEISTQQLGFVPTQPIQQTSQESLYTIFPNFATGFQSLPQQSADNTTAPPQGMPPTMIDPFTAAHYMAVAAARHQHALSSMFAQQQHQQSQQLHQQQSVHGGSPSRCDPPLPAAQHLAAMTGVTNTSAPGRRGPLLYIPTDDDILSANQIFLRKQIEFFEAAFEDVGKTTSGRRRPIMLNQVGIQCKHCGALPAKYRQKGAVYYPAKLSGIYQAAQNMSVTHMTSFCDAIDEKTREELKSYQQGRSVTGHGGKQYWADTAKAQGVVEVEEGGLRFSEEAGPASGGMLQQMYQQHPFPGPSMMIRQSWNAPT